MGRSLRKVRIVRVLKGGVTCFVGYGGITAGVKVRVPGTPSFMFAGFVQ